MTLKEGFLSQFFDDSKTIKALEQGYYSKDTSFSEIERDFPSCYFLFKKLAEQIFSAEIEGRKFSGTIDGDDWLGVQISPISDEYDQLIEFVTYIEVEYIDQKDEDGDPKIDQGQIQIVFDKDFYYQINWSTSSERGKIELDSRGNL